jgi:hypothetical protein
MTIDTTVLYNSIILLRIEHVKKKFTLLIKFSFFTVLFGLTARSLYLQEIIFRVPKPIFTMLDDPSKSPYESVNVYQKDKPGQERDKALE